MPSGDDAEPAGPYQPLDGGEGDLQEAEGDLQEAQSFPLAGAGQRTGVDGAQPARATMLKAFRTRGRSGGDALFAAAEAAAGTTSGSNVSNVSGFFVMPTRTLPASWSPRCASTSATAG
jgi:hypothetical protein